MSEEGKLQGLGQTHQIHSYQQRWSGIRQLSASTPEISGSTHGSRCLLQESGQGDGVISPPSWSCCETTRCFWSLLQRPRSCKVSWGSDPWARSRRCLYRGSWFCTHMKQRFGNGINWHHLFPQQQHWKGLGSLPKMGAVLQRSPNPQGHGRAF